MRFPLSGSHGSASLRSSIKLSREKPSWRIPSGPWLEVCRWRSTQRFRPGTVRFARHGRSQARRYRERCRHVCRANTARVRRSTFLLPSRCTSPSNRSPKQFCSPFPLPQRRHDRFVKVPAAGKAPGARHPHSRSILRSRPDGAAERFSRSPALHTGRPGTKAVASSV